MAWLFILIAAIGVVGLLVIWGIIHLVHKWFYFPGHEPAQGVWEHDRLDDITPPHAGGSGR